MMGLFHCHLAVVVEVAVELGAMHGYMYIYSHVIRAARL